MVLLNLTLCVCPNSVFWCCVCITLRITLVRKWNQKPSFLQICSVCAARKPVDTRNFAGRNPTIHHLYIPCLSHKALETRRTQGLHRKTTTKKKTTDIIARVAQEIIIIIIIFFVSSIFFSRRPP
jgi:hypothetical protein